MHKNLARRLSDTPIAIVGLGALYPRSGDLREFWANVVAARDCITDVPATHWRVEDYYDPDPSAPDKTYCKRGGFIPTVDFNPVEFGLPPNILEVTDVLQLLSLVVAKQTLADCVSAGDRSRTGVVLGITGANSLTQPLATRLQTPVLREVVRSCGLSDRDADEIAAKFVKAFAPWEENSFPGMLGNVVAGRIANRFDLGGMNCTVDAACASSLAAVQMAVSELVSGRADLMITGGCDAENTILMYLCFSKTPALSRSGIVRPFDEDSDGTLIGEGIGMLALKRLADAERDGDRVYAVLRGIGASSDGRFKSIYAPRAEGQMVALRRAYDDAGLGPSDIGLLECHGTGTAVGDLTELAALREVFTAAATPLRSTAVGSVKSQIGHTKAAAGAAGMIKLALALHQKVLPPTINVTRPRRAAEFGSSPFYVNTEARPWVREPARPLRAAAVSSFGFGGTNFHCVLTEHDPSGTGLRMLHETARVHVWHAPTRDELLAQLDAQPGGMPDGEPIPAVHARLAVVAVGATELASLRTEAAARLRRGSDEAFELPKGAYYRPSAMAQVRIAALFAGQGSQYRGMGTAAAMALPPVRAAFDEAALEFGAYAEPLARVVFPPPAFDDQERSAQDASLRRTDYAQPAIGALSVGQYRYLATLGFAADAVIGHSFGELTALWAAGSLTGTEMFRLARVRGAAMARRPCDAADAGAMAAVRAPLERVESLLVAFPEVAVCSLNAPEQVIVGGGTGAVDALVAACADAGVSAVRLPVAAAFHTSYVAHAAADFAAAVSTVDVAPPRIPVYANTGDAGYGPSIEANRSVLVGQLREPVRFAPRVREMYDAGLRVFVEFGPNSVLSGLVRATLADRPDVIVIAADAGPGRDGDRSLKQLAARLAVLGMPLTGFNRYAAELPAPEPKSGMRIALNGVNYVSDKRRTEYQGALRDGYRVEPVPAPQSPAPVSAEVASAEVAAPVEVAASAGITVPAEVTPPSQPSVAPAPVITGMPMAAGMPTIGAIAADHLAMHRDYLGSQLAIAERLAGLLISQASAGGPSDAMVAGINAVTEHSLAISQSHVYASEVLRGFAHLEAGSPPPPAGGPMRGSAPPVEQPISNGHTNGHVNGGPSGELNGHSNGYMGGYGQLGGGSNGDLNGHSNGYVGGPVVGGSNGDLNGHSNGYVGGGSSGDPNGHMGGGSNGDMNGHSNGYASGQVGGGSSGDLNGHTNGYANGQMNGHSDGYANDHLAGHRPVQESVAAAPESRVSSEPGITVTEGTLGAEPPGVVSGGTPGAESPTSAVSGEACVTQPQAPAGGHSADAVREALLAIVSEKTGYPADMVDLSMDVEADLGIDSIKRVEIMGALREAFGASAASPETLAELRTLEDIVGFVAGAGQVVAGPKAAATPPLAASLPV